MNQRAIRMLALRDAAGLLDNDMDCVEAPTEIVSLPDAERDRCDDLWRKEVREIVYSLRTRYQRMRKRQTQDDGGSK